MNKINVKPSTGREPRYVPYRSFHNNQPRNSKSSSVEEQRSSTTSSEATKVKKSSKKVEHAAVVRQLSGHKGDNVAGAGSGMKKISKQHSESQTTCTEAFLRDQEKMEGDLARLEGVKRELDEEIAQLKASNEILSEENARLRQTIASVELRNEELLDQYELNSDQIKELLRSNEEGEERIRELESSLEHQRGVAESRFQDLENENKELTQLIGQLHSVNEEKDRTVEQLSSFKEKWENYKGKLERALIEKQELAERIAKDASIVTLLREDFTVLQRKHEELKDRNDQLQKNVAERKKNEELLRQKCDELKKQNRKEKANERVLKCGSGSRSLSSIIDRKDADGNKEARELSTTSLKNRLSQRSRKNHESTLQEQSYYSILHRTTDESDRVPKLRKS